MNRKQPLVSDDKKVFIKNEIDGISVLKPIKLSKQKSVIIYKY